MVEAPLLERPMRTCPTCNATLPGGGESCPACERELHAPPSTWVLLRLWRFARPYRWQLLLGITLMLGSTAARLVPPYLTIPLMDEVLVPFQTGAEIPSAKVAWILGGLFGAALFAWVLGWMTTWLLAIVSERIAADMRTTSFEHLLGLQLNVDIEGERDVLAMLHGMLGVGPNFQHPTARVELQPASAGFSPQPSITDRLDSPLPDTVNGALSQDLRGTESLGMKPPILGPESPSIGGEFQCPNGGHFFGTQPAFDPQKPLLGLAMEPLGERPRIETQHTRELLGDLRLVGHAPRSDEEALHLERGGEDPPLAVEQVARTEIGRAHV